MVAEINRQAVEFTPTFAFPAWSEGPCRRRVRIYRAGRSTDSRIAVWNSPAGHFDPCDDIPAWHASRIVGQARRLLQEHLDAVVGFCASCHKEVYRRDAAWTKGICYCPECIVE